MRKFLILICLFAAGISACSTERTNRNPYLQEISFRIDLDLNLPLYNGLNTIGNPVYVGLNGAGTRGVFVMQTSIDLYQAYEASCPNHVPNDCSTMRINGIEVECDCEGYRYNLFTGQMSNRPQTGSVFYDLLRYNVLPSGNTLIVTN